MSTIFTAVYTTDFATVITTLQTANLSAIFPTDFATVNTTDYATNDATFGSAVFFAVWSAYNPAISQSYHTA